MDTLRPGGPRALRDRGHRAVRGDRWRPAASSPATPGSSPAVSCTRAFEQLRTMGLVRHDPPATPGSPRTPTWSSPASSRPLSQQGAELLEESSHWAQAFGALSQAWRKAPGAVRARPVHATCTADGDRPVPRRPRRRGRGGGAHRAAADRPRHRTRPRRASLRRRRRCSSAASRSCTLYQHSARRSSVTREYVAAVTDLRRRGPHAGRVLQPDDRRRPADRGHPVARTTWPRRSRSASRRSSPTSSTSSCAPGSGPGRSPAARPRW